MYSPGIGFGRQAYAKCFLMLAIAVFGTFVYFLFYAKQSSINSKIIIVLAYLGVALLSVTSFFVYKRVQVSVKSSKKQKGNTLQNKIIALFSGVAIVPLICAFLFSLIFFNIGLENLFKAPIKNVIENSAEITDFYIAQVKASLSEFVRNLGNQIDECVNEFSVDNVQISSIISEIAYSTKMEASVIRIDYDNSIKVIASTPFALALQFGAFPEYENIEDGEVITWHTGETMFSFSLINRELRMYLVTSLPIDSDITEHKRNIRSAIDEYQELSLRNSEIRISFTFLFFAVAVLLILGTVATGTVFARKVMKPVRFLINATNRMSLDEQSIQIDVKKTGTELDELVSRFNEMTKRIETQQEQLAEAKKMEAWRDVARKIAHEIKNPLTPIQLSAERIRSKYHKEISSSPEVFNSCIDTIVRQVDCIGRLVKEFSDFARMPEPKMEQVDIVMLIKQGIAMQANAHPEIKFIQNYARNECLCKMDPEQISQVITNITQNAINSIIENNVARSPFKGRIVMNFEVKEDKINISIEDDGVGFSDSALEKALEPYYTTRQHGTGLGLAIVNKIMVDHGGKILLGNSEELGGAKVSLVLPYGSDNCLSGSEGMNVI